MFFPFLRFHGYTGFVKYGYFCHDEMCNPVFKRVMMKEGVFQNFSIDQGSIWWIEDYFYESKLKNQLTCLIARIIKKNASS